MSILVVCPGCQAEFKVSDKFAGKTGPCPKCKAKIKIPELESDDVKVHAPEDAPVGSATAQARAVAKPIARRETTLRPLPALGVLAAIVMTFAVAHFVAPAFHNVAVRGVALLIVGVPICAAGYSFLRDDELEPYRGGPLWIRSSICSVLYAALWSALLFLPADFVKDVYAWFFVAPPLLAAGAGIALACFDFDFGTGFFHNAFYVVVTLALGWAAKLTMPWDFAAL